MINLQSILEEAMEYGDYLSAGIFNGHVSAIYKAMANYAQAKCKEQREMCEVNARIETVTFGATPCGEKVVGVLDAPEPNYD
jgi:hypothetical protein